MSETVPKPENLPVKPSENGTVVTQEPPNVTPEPFNLAETEYDITVPEARSLNRRVG